MAGRRKKATGKFYAWSDLYNGGETDEVRGRTLVIERNMVERGESVSQDSLGVSDDEWQSLLDGGSVRDYPLPDGLGENESPHAFVTRQMFDENENLDLDLLMKLNNSMSIEATAQPDEEVREVHNPAKAEDAADKAVAEGVVGTGEKGDPTA